MVWYRLFFEKEKTFYKTKSFFKKTKKYKILFFFLKGNAFLFNGFHSDRACGKDMDSHASQYVCVCYLYKEEKKERKKERPG